MGEPAKFYLCDHSASDSHVVCVNKHKAEGLRQFLPHEENENFVQSEKPEIKDIHFRHKIDIDIHFFPSPTASIDQSEKIETSPWHLVEFTSLHAFILNIYFL